MSAFRAADFDPIGIESEMVAHHVLPPRSDPAAGPLGDLEQFFTEFSDRSYALWRISMARQLSPALMRGLALNDLLFLAGQTSTGYDVLATAGIALQANKVDQNRERARIELDRRIRRVAWWQSLLLVAIGAGAGYLLGR
jgi:hypothetical protein